MKENNKKVILLSILGVLLLIMVVVGITYAMYSFSATGTKENVIQTGSVNISFDKKSVVNLTNQYPVSDAKGVELENGKLEYDVVANLSGVMTINYKLFISDIKAGDTLTAEYIKFNLAKSVGEGEASYVIGSASSGVSMKGYTNSETIATGTFTASGKDHYVLRAWVGDNYKLPNQTIKGKCVDTDGNDVVGATAETCTGKWEQKSETTSETFSFKVKVEAVQV